MRTFVHHSEMLKLLIQTMHFLPAQAQAPVLPAPFPPGAVLPAPFPAGAGSGARSPAPFPPGQAQDSRLPLAVTANFRHRSPQSFRIGRKLLVRKKRLTFAGLTNGSI